MAQSGSVDVGLCVMFHTNTSYELRLRGGFLKILSSMLVTSKRPAASINAQNHNLHQLLKTAFEALHVFHGKQTLKKSKLKPGLSASRTFVCRAASVCFGDKRPYVKFVQLHAWAVLNPVNTANPGQANTQQCYGRYYLANTRALGSTVPLFMRRTAVIAPSPITLRS